MRDWLVILLLGVLGSGCGPRPVYYGYNVPRSARLEVIEHRGEQYVRYGGQEQTRYRGIGLAGLAPSADGKHLAYPAQRRGRWLVVRDAREEGDWDGVGPLSWSADSQHLAYAARLGKAWHIVLDGRPGPPWDSIVAASLSLSSDGKHLVYAARRGPSVQVVRDGQSGPAFDGIAQLTLDPQGNHLSYLARRQTSAYVRCDGRELGPYQLIAELVQGADGQCAFIAKRSHRWRVYFAETELGAHDSAAGLTLSATGELAYVARQGDQERVVRSRRPGPPYRKIDWQSLRFSADGQHFSYIARAEETALVVQDAVPGPRFPDVQGLSVVGAHVAYVVTLPDEQRRVVFDGKPGPSYTEIVDLQLAPDGARAIYLAQRRGRSRVVTPDGELPFALILPGSLTWSRDGAHWGCLAGTQVHDLNFVIDGRPQRAFAMGEYYQSLLQAGQPQTTKEPSSLLRSWVAAELDRAQADPPPVSSGPAIPLPG